MHCRVTRRRIYRLGHLEGRLSDTWTTVPAAYRRAVVRRNSGAGAPVVVDPTRFIADACRTF
jgi:hypothetical protein